MSDTQPGFMNPRSNRAGPTELGQYLMHPISSSFFLGLWPNRQTRGTSDGSGLGALYRMQQTLVSLTLSIFSLSLMAVGCEAADGLPAGESSRAPAPAFFGSVAVGREATEGPMQGHLGDFAYYVDSGGKASVEEVAELAVRQPAAFTATPGYYNGGYSAEVKWLKFTVSAPPGEWWLAVLPPFLDDLRLYEPSAHGWIEHRAG